MPAIQTHRVSKRYGDVTAVDRVDLTVEKGEIFGFLGHNGAGKSTVINMLLDFARPTEGRVEVFGMDAREESVAVREHMGVLPEGYDVYDRLTGRQHLQFAAESKGVEVEPVALAERVGIRDAIDRPAGGYSKGMAQRLVLGMALIGEPDLLILDEPTSGLDPGGARRMREIIHEENERGATVFFSSHILEQIEAVCDRVGIMHEGRLQAVDTIDALRDAVAGGTKLRVTVDDPSEAHLDTIEGVDGVDAAWIEDEAFSVTCPNDVKMDVLVALDDAGVDVLDFSTEEASLEDLFVEYTREGGQ
ncbi:ABC transporter ATP-binding protein [Halolamina litorea]|uniref:ATP-binding cassette domain-containing protein n=1 Tax=Halolamina litorea TaxID=1515593 RepID=A0ABD6BPJ9_9EURY|nr:ABC transporter ATP-binding protein [Halolamina litorea]